MPLPLSEQGFHPKRQWRLDWVWPDLGNVVIEVEGGTGKTGKSRHTSKEGFENDARKYNEAQLRGHHVYRVTTGMVLSGEAVSVTLRALQFHGGYVHHREGTKWDRTSKAMAAVD